MPKGKVHLNTLFKLDSRWHTKRLRPLFSQIILAVGIGVLSGVFTGLIPGVHINLVSLLLLSVSGYLLGVTSPIVLACFIISMAVVHTFLDSIPSVFLGAPDADQALNVLPGHRLLLEGKGYEAVKLTVIGSLLALVLTVILIPVLMPFVPIIYNSVKGYMGWILLAIVSFMVLKEKKVFWSFFVFFISGLLGIIVLSMPNLEQPLFPMLSGMFGISTLVTSLSNNVKIPKQVISESIKVPKSELGKALGAAVFSGSLTGIFPGLGAAQAAIIGREIVGRMGHHAFMVLVGGINTVNFLFSLVTLYMLEKARNGAVLVVLEIVKGIDLNGLIVLLGVALVAGGVATFLAFLITRVFCNVIGKVNYKLVCSSVIIFVSGMVFFFSGWTGIFVLLVSTAIGIIPALKGVGRNHAMGCLLMPVILYFLL